MKWKSVLLLLILWTVFNPVYFALYQSEASTSVRYSDLNPWFKLLSRWIPIRIATSNNSGHETPLIESSFPEEEVRSSNYFPLLRQVIISDDYGGPCTCSCTACCSTTCTSLKIQCGKTCTITTEFSASLTTYDTSPIYGYPFETTETIYNYFTYSTGCENVTTECTTTTYPGISTAPVVDQTEYPSVTPVLTDTIPSVYPEPIGVTTTPDVIPGTPDVIPGTTVVTPGSTTVIGGISFAALAATAIAVTVAVAIAVGIAVPVALSSSGTPTDVINPVNPANTFPNSFNPPNEIQVLIEQFLSSGLIFINSVPTNNGGIPVPGIDLPDDGCGTSSGRIDDGRNSTQINGRRTKRQAKWDNEQSGNCTRQKDKNLIKNDDNWIKKHGIWNIKDNGNCTQREGECHQLLSRGPCRNPRHWFTLDPVTLKVIELEVMADDYYDRKVSDLYDFRLIGRCTPRLCGRGRVFVGKTGLCHDSEDPSICSGGRKLFYTAYGDPICDCPVGKYPFPGEQGDCVTLFTRGPCQLGQVLAFNQAGNLQCMPSQCKFNANDLIPLSPYEDGLCYALGSQGPCRSEPFQLFGYDVFERRTLCVNVTAIGSPYFELDEDIDVLDKNYNQLSPEYDDFRFFFTTDPAQNSAGRRQGDALTAGLIQLPANFPKDPMINACKPGAQNGNNYKCSNPVVNLGKKTRLLQAVRSAFECPNGSVLQATGKCGNDDRSASCGPSYQYVESIGECRAIVQISAPSNSSSS